MCALHFLQSRLVSILSCKTARTSYLCSLVNRYGVWVEDDCISNEFLTISTKPRHESVVLLLDYKMKSKPMYYRDYTTEFLPTEAYRGMGLLHSIVRLKMATIKKSKTVATWIACQQFILITYSTIIRSRTSLL